MKEGNYFVSTPNKSQTEVLLKSIDHLEFTDAENDQCGATEKQVGSFLETQKSNVNVSRGGVEPVALKVYHWFDDYENLDTNEMLIPSQVEDLTNQGKVAKNRLNPTELEILWEELVNGPFSGDRRDLKEC